MFCNRCGNKVSDSDMFCKKCGNRIICIDDSNGDIILSDSDNNEPDKKSVSENFVNQVTNESIVIDENSIDNNSVEDKISNDNSSDDNSNDTDESNGLFEWNPHDVGINNNKKDIISTQTDTTPQYGAVPNGSTIINKKIIIIVICVIFGIIALFIAFAVIASHFSPENTAKNFVDDIQNSKWSNVYDMLDYNDNEFITEENFEYACEYYNSEVFGENLLEYSTLDVELDKNSVNTKSVTRYNLIANGERTNTTFLVYESEDSNTLFKSYKINLDNSPVYDYFILAPAESSVTLDGIKLSSSASDDATTSEYYCSVFPGDYLLSVSHDNCIPEDYDITVRPNYVYNESDYNSECMTGQVSPTMFAVSTNFNDEYANAVNKIAKDTMSIILNNIKNKKCDISTVRFTSQELADECVEDIIDTIEHNQNNDSDYRKYGSITIDLLEFDESNSPEMYFTYQTDKTYKFVFTYDYSYTISYYSDGQLTRTSNENESNNGYITMKCISGEWIVDDYSFYMYQ